MTAAPAPRELDVVVFGATGFVGSLTAAYLAEHAPPTTRVGLAGRSLDRLTATRTALGPRAADWPLIVADSSEPASLAALAARTTAVASTVGPYARYGLPLVEACAAAGTHYADLTGEVLFVRDSIDAHDGAARASGARIVHACGFDSVPSDLGTLLVHEAVQADAAGEMTDTALLLVSARGGVSGGTIDSLRTQVDVSRGDAGLRRTLGDPYALSPDRAAEPALGREGDQLLPARDELLGRWTAPFVMAPFNTRVVRRSNALLGHAYGAGFRYREVMGVGRTPLAPVLAGAVSAGLAVLAGGMALPPARFVLDRVLPKPGDGPSEKTRRTGHFTVEVHSRTTTGAHYVATVSAQGDPGYTATAVMLGESVLSLALDDLPPRAGVLTPATAMGGVLTARLRAAGFTMTVARRPDTGAPPATSARPAGAG